METKNESLEADVPWRIRDLKNRGIHRDGTVALRDLHRGVSMAHVQHGAPYA